MSNTVLPQATDAVLRSIVDANYRFMAASQEVNARVTQRQQALALYVSMLVSLLAALVALRPSPTLSAVPIEWLILGFPISSISFAFLNYKSERAISHLRRYLSVLECLGQAHVHLPSYNTDPEWSIGANKARRFHDHAVTILVAGGNLAGLGAALKIYPERVAQSPIFMYFSAFLALLALAVVLFTHRWSYLPEVK